ncbi:hypothetical protein Dimus_037917 [Dionaea muscipula]
MTPKRRPKVLAPPSVRIPIPGEKSTGEEGEIEPPPHATKRPRSSLDSPPREAAATAQPPAQLKGFASRNEPGRVETIVRGMEPSASVGSKPLKKRVSSLYSPSTPAMYFKHPSYTVTRPAPTIQNLPFPKRPLMTCEDNALAAFQAVSNATDADTNFYLNEFGMYEKDWIDRDMWTSLARLMVATEASMRARNKAQDRIFEKNREIQLAEGARDYHKGEAENYKAKFESCQQELLIVDKKEAQAKEDLVRSRREVDLLKIDDERHQRETAATRQEVEVLRSENERLRKKLEEERLRGARVDLQAVKDANLIAWIDEWHASSEGLEWIQMSGQGAQMQGYQAALRHLSSHIPPGPSRDDL